MEPAGDLDDGAFDLCRIVGKPASGCRVGEGLEMCLDGAYLRDVSMDRAFDVLCDRMGLVERELARELEMERGLDAVVGVDQLQVVELAHLRDRHRSRSHPLAELAVREARLDVDDDVARGSTRCTASSTRSAAACP